MGYRSVASFGKRREYSAIADLLKKDYDVYMTLVDDRGIDCVLRISPKRYLDIQIKARSKECKPFDAGRFAAMDITDPRDNYFFIFYSEQTDVHWIIPSTELIKLASKNKKGQNVGKYHLNLCGLKKGKAYTLDKFKKYQEAWKLLK